MSDTRAPELLGVGQRTDQKTRAVAVLIALQLGLPAPAFALDIKYEVGGTARASDNIALVETNPLSDVLLSSSITFEAEQSGASLELNAQGRFEYLYYAENTLDEKTRGEMIGELDWTIAPERAHFIVQDYLTREPVNAFESPTSANEQIVNILVAGPTFYTRFNDATRGQLDLRYANSAAQESKDFNSDRHGIAGRLLREVGPNQRVSANVEASRVDYSNARSAFDYTRQDGYLGYERNLAAIDIKADAGYSWLKPKSGGASLSGPLVRANVDWRLAPRSLIGAVVAYQITDATQNLIARGNRLDGSAIGDLFNTNPDAILTPELFRTRRGDLRYVFADERVALTVRTYFEQLRYVKARQLDETSSGAVFDLGYKFRPRWNLAFQVGREDRKFDASNREDADLFMNVAIANDITRHWTWMFELIHRQRDSNFVGGDYEENAAAISLFYRR